MSTKYKAYPAYKDSGVEWLGEIPEGWDVIELRRTLLGHKQGYYTTEGYVDDGVKLLRITDLRDYGYIDYSECPKVSSSDDSLKLYDLVDGDVVFARTGGAGTFGVVDQIKERVVFASYLIRFRFSKSYFHNGFLRFVLLCDATQQAIKQNIHGGVNQNIHAEDIKNAPLLLPSLPEQQAIAAFLDRETGKIDELIGKQERLIELLEEKRQAVISHAVTKGLDANVPLKDSGVQWLGQIPEHWDIQKAKYLFEEKNRPVRNIDGIITVFRDGQVCLRSRRRTSGFTMAVLEHGYQGIRKGDLVLHGMDAFAGAIGVSEDDGRATPEYVVTRPLNCEMNCEYYADILRLMAERDYIFILCPSVRERAPRFRFSKFQQVLLPIPPTQEQDEIKRHLKSISDKYIKLSIKAKKQIELLQERRTALISAAVTGKIDVRGQLTVSGEQ